MFDPVQRMAILIPTTVTNDLGRFEAHEFGDPKWIILRNNSGLQLQMFWPNKDGTEPTQVKQENGQSLNQLWNRTPNNNQSKKRKRKRSPQRLIQGSDEDARDHDLTEHKPLDETTSSTSEIDDTIDTSLTSDTLMSSQMAQTLNSIYLNSSNSLIHGLINATMPSDSSSSSALPSGAGSAPPRPRARRSPAPRFYPLTDPVVKFLQETLQEDPQGRVACADLSDLSAKQFGNPINMVSMGMKLRFLYPCVTRVKINNRAFYTNVKVRDNALAITAHALTADPSMPN